MNVLQVTENGSRERESAERASAISYVRGGGTSPNSVTLKEKMVETKEKWT